jgi:CheY-like chemotaxis protein
LGEHREKPRMLIVEDSSAYQELYAELFCATYDLQIVNSSAEAKTCLRKGRYDVILVDMRLRSDERNNTEGLDVAELAYALDPSVAIVLSSGYPTENPGIVQRLERVRARVLAKGSCNQVEALLDAVPLARSERPEE